MTLWRIVFKGYGDRCCRAVCTSQLSMRW